MAATSDPGFIPKQPDDEHTSKWWRQFKNYVVVDGMNGQKTHLVHLKLCYVCMIMRPKRSTHCRQCDVCCEQFDHHCPYIANCVGRRNYVYFFGFINTLFLDCVYLVWITFHDIDRRVQMYKLIIQTELDSGVRRENLTYKNAYW